MVKAKQTPRQSTRGRGRSHSLSLTTRASAPTSSIRGRCPSPPSSCRSSPTSSTIGRCPSPPSSCSSVKGLQISSGSGSGSSTPPSDFLSAYDLGRQIETICSGFDFGIPPSSELSPTETEAKWKSFMAGLGVTKPRPYFGDDELKRTRKFSEFRNSYVHKKLELQHKKQEREMHEREMHERITAAIQRSCRAAAKELVREIKQMRMERKALVLAEHLNVKLKM